MKRIWFTLAIACLAMTGTARADVWGRIIPNTTTIARTQDKAETVPVQDPEASKSAVQAPADAVQHDGYPFADRCGCKDTDCCANIWKGYSRSCGSGIGRGLFAHGNQGCGGGRMFAAGLGTQCCGNSGCAGFGGYNSFAGGVSYGGCDCGVTRGLGWPACGLHSLAAYGKHHLHGLRRVCGFGCDSDCTTCDGATGCNSCNGKTHHHDGAGEKNMGPPAPPGEPTPMTDKDQEGPAPASQKSAFRPSYSSASRRLPAGF